ncbi:MAG TPA: ABC transporter substrate-binding protein [Candidatus Binatia bacterium]|jgi:NitT/TauT family transport system substrate-binding protein
MFKYLRFYFALSAALGVLTWTQPSLSATPNRKLTIIFADFSERAGIVFVAKEQRFFDEQGVDVDVVQVRSGPVAISALAANEAQFYMVSATGSTLGAMASGLDLAFIAGLVNKLDGYFVTNSKIRVPEDLKGKILGVQSIGGGIWMFAYMALDHWGINPDRDKMQIRVIGDQSVLAQAMTSGLIDASVLGYAFSQVVQRAGGRILAELPKLNIPYQGSGLVARRSFVSGSPDSVEKTLRALVKANLFIQDKNNQAAVLRTLRKWLRLSANEGGEELYDRMRLLYDRRIVPSREGIQNALRVLSKADPKYAKIRAEDLIDDRIIRKLD